MSERKEIVLEPPVMTRNAALEVISTFFNAHKGANIKSIRFDHAPLDKKGDIIDMIIYAFREEGDYVMFFPKRIRVPLKTGSQDQFRSAIVDAIEKIMPSFDGEVPMQIGFVDSAINIVVDQYFKAEEDRAIAALPQIERTLYLIDRMKDDGTLDRFLKEELDKENDARKELGEAFAHFDSLTDEQFHQLVDEHVVRCNSEEYGQEMRHTWTDMGIQYDVTLTLHAVASYIMERGPELTPEWGKEDESKSYKHDFHREFHSYRGLTIRFDSCAVDSGYHLYKDDGVHLILI